MSRQLTFDLPALDKLTRAEFVVTPVNALALAALDGWQGWPGGKMLLVGPPGAGKTHLAAIWAHDAGALRIGAAALQDMDLGQLPEGAAVLVEDAEAVAGTPQAEAALFHLHNLVTPGGRLLVTATEAPRDWGLRLPDLLSRMQAAPLTRIEAPDDALLAAVLAKLFADRQIAPPPALIPWLLPRMDRTIAAARALVAALDARALAERRPLSTRLAAEVLDSAPDE